jgi:ABC-type glutathione transport system ATPase component
VTPSSQSPIANRPPGVASPLLSVENLTIALPVDGVFRAAVDGVSFSVNPGEAVAVVGESGCGKSQPRARFWGLAGGRGSRVRFASAAEACFLSDREWRAVADARSGWCSRSRPRR